MRTTVTPLVPVLVLGLDACGRGAPRGGWVPLSGTARPLGAVRCGSRARRWNGHPLLPAALACCRSLPIPLVS